MYNDMVKMPLTLILYRFYSIRYSLQKKDVSIKFNIILSISKHGTQIKKYLCVVLDTFLYLSVSYDTENFIKSFTEKVKARLPL